MAGPSKSKTPLQQGVRLSPEQHARLSRISEELTRRAAGAPIGIPTAIKLTVDRGTPILEKELGLSPEISKSDTSRPRKTAKK